MQGFYLSATDYMLLKLHRLSMSSADLRTTRFGSDAILIACPAHLSLVSLRIMSAESDTALRSNHPFWLLGAYVQALALHDGLLSHVSHKALNSKAIPNTTYICTSSQSQNFVFLAHGLSSF